MNCKVGLILSYYELYICLRLQICMVELIHGYCEKFINRSFLEDFLLIPLAFTYDVVYDGHD